MKLNFSVLKYYLYCLVFIKLLYSVTFFSVYYFKIFNADNKTYIPDLQLIYEYLEWIFLTMFFILIIYMFYKDRREIMDYNMRKIFYVGGIIGIFSQFGRINIM